MEDSRAPAEKEYVAGLERGLSVIEAFGILNRPLTLSEVAEVTGHTRASARRSLLTLQRLGYVEAEGKLFRLAPRVLRLGHAYVTSSAIPKLVQPILEGISERSRESSSLAVLDGNDVVFVARAATRRSLSNGLGLGSRLPAYCAATGRALLAGLEPADAELRLQRTRRVALTPHTRTAVADIMALLNEVRGKGYAICDQELELGVRSIAVPVRDRRGHTVAAMSIVASVRGYGVDSMVENLLPHLESGRRMLASSL
ncbi:MAG TPA: IclR family transcriptional regulator C-terminal domain-containing protein [Acetobacteraceae bacterium]|jgi:IclR family pca regulon transcriptional regulator